MNEIAGTGEKADQRATPVIPPMFIALAAVSVVFLGAGSYALGAPQALPVLVKPAGAWSLIAVGLMLDVAAMFVFVTAQRSRRR